MTETVLIIEDDLSTQRLLGDVLESSGYRCHGTNNAEDGLTMAVELKPDFIIMDIKLPGMDGLMATDKLRGMPCLENTRIIGMSAHAMPGDLAVISRYRFDFFLIKPFSYRTLLDYLRT